MKKIFFFMLKHTLKCLHYINTSSMFLFFSPTWCPTEIVSSRSNTYSCRSLSNDRCLFAALILYTKFCWNMGYILYTNISYTFGIQNDTKICRNMEYILYINILYTFCIHQFWSTKSVHYKHYAYNLYTKFIQNVIQIIVCRLDPLFQHILTCLLCTS